MTCSEPVLFFKLNHFYFPDKPSYRKCFTLVVDYQIWLIKRFKLSEPTLKLAIKKLMKFNWCPTKSSKFNWVPKRDVVDIRCCKQEKSMFYWTLSWRINKKNDSFLRKQPSAIIVVHYRAITSHVYIDNISYMNKSALAIICTAPSTSSFESDHRNAWTGWITSSTDWCSDFTQFWVI